MTMDAFFPDALLIDIDRTGPVPLYHQIARRLEAAIRSGEMPAGTRLLNEIELGARLYLSRGTIRRAVQELADRGLVERRRGAGTRVLQIG